MQNAKLVPRQESPDGSLPHNKSIEDMLAEGEVDALIHSDIIKPIEAGDPRVARLWPDYKAEEIRFWKKTQIFPIMHVMGIRQEIVDRHPWIPVNLFHAFEKSKAIAIRWAAFAKHQVRAAFDPKLREYIWQKSYV